MLRAWLFVLLNPPSPRQACLPWAEAGKFIKGVLLLKNF